MTNSAYKIAICDDSQADTEYLTTLVKEWAKDRTAIIKTFPSAEAFLFNYAEEKDFDILLLDIEMGKMDGVTMAKVIRQDNESVQIVFITGYSEYIADGYDVAALHYLIKPVKTEQLLSVLDRAAERLKKNEKELLLKTADETVVMPVREIRYLDVQQNYVTVHGKADVTVKRTTCVRRISKTEVILTDGSAIPLPRGQYDALNRAIIART